jgi:hypothetical protein
MVTDPGSNHGAPTATPPGQGERRPRSERFWSWLRVAVLLLVALGLGVWGYLLRPSPAKNISVFLPKITVLANKRYVTATVDMTLSSNQSQTPPYSLTLTITPANPGQSVKFAVSFGGFPTPASGTGPLHGSHNAYYTVINSTPGLFGAASRSKRSARLRQPLLRTPSGVTGNTRRCEHAGAPSRQPPRRPPDRATAAAYPARDAPAVERMRAAGRCWRDFGRCAASTCCADPPRTAGGRSAATPGVWCASLKAARGTVRYRLLGAGCSAMAITHLPRGVQAAVTGGAVSDGSAGMASVAARRRIAFRISEVSRARRFTCS